MFLTRRMDHAATSDDGRAAVDSVRSVSTDNNPLTREADSMSQRRSAVTIALALAIALSGTVAIAGVGLAQTSEPVPQGTVRGEPDIDVHLPKDTVLPGEKTQLKLQVSNDGEMDFGPLESQEAVTAARNVRVEAEAEGPLTVETGRMAIGTVTTSRPGSAQIALTIPEGTEPGTYEIDVEVAYRYTDTAWIGSNRVKEDTETVTRTVEVTVDDAPRFEITNATTDVRSGDQGTMDVTLQNTGSQTADDVQLALDSTSSSFLFGQVRTDTARVDTLAPGDNTTLEYDVTVPPDTTARDYALSGTVTYTDPDGIPGVDKGLSVGVRPLAEQTFAVETVASTLRVGEEGQLRGTVTNTGPSTVNDVVLQYADESATSIVPTVSNVAIGDLEPGETGTFELPLEVTTSGKATTRSLDMAVTYRNDENEKRAYEAANAIASIEPRRDQFAIAVDDDTVAAGGQRTVTATVTNQLDEPVSDVNVRMFVDDPLDSTEDEGYIGSLAPGESETVTLQLSASGDAVAKVYPTDFDVNYEDADGISKNADTVTLPITVTDGGDSGLPVIAIAIGALLVVLVVGGFWYWRS
ncbi:S-layer protein [Halapricum desulfuricans]|uniref:S-layer protein n=2 Tax=Halapricum desulfuricans TaxID=2841257 RepID=A0A897NK84_9EURY|nr:S-layer protein [Halapricum desulfuricans]